MSRLTPSPALLALAITAPVLLGGCQKNQLAQILPPGARVDVFPQASQAQLDAIFIVDDSRYMGVHQARVAASFSSFLGWLDNNQIDYHLGLLSSDVPTSPGKYLGGGTQQFFTSANVQDLPAAVIALGGNGSAIGAVLEQLDLALRGPPANFLRSGAALFLVIVTDDADPWSPAPDLYYFRTFKSAKGPGDTGIVTLSVLAGDVPGGCYILDPNNPSQSFFAEPAPRLINLAQEMGGTFNSLCTPDFNSVFDALGAQAAGLKRAFHLTVTPDPATLQVSIRATCSTPRAALAFCAQTTDDCNDAPPAIVCTPPKAAAPADGWSFDPTSNSIIFSGAALPPRGAEIDVTYTQAAGGVAQ